MGEGSDSDTLASTVVDLIVSPSSFVRPDGKTPKMESAVSSQSINQDVYQATKNIFVGETARFRKPKLVKKTVDSHAGRNTSVRCLINQHGPERVYQTVLKLLSDRVYESSQIAHRRFPDLFKSSEAQSEARFQLEVEAARSEQAAIEGVIRRDSLDDQGGLEGNATSLSLHGESSQRMRLSKTI